MSTAFPGPGAKLPLATYTGSGTAYPEPTWASMRTPTYTIPANGYSMPMAVDDAQQFRFIVKYASAPTDVTTIEIAPDPVFVSTETQTLDTIPAATGTETVGFWSTDQGVQYSGQVRIKNTSGVSITGVWAQKQVSSSGGHGV